MKEMTVDFEKAKAIPLSINGVDLQALPKEFKTGSLGWSLTTKLRLPLGDQEVNCQIGLNMTIIGSKPKKKEEG